MNNAILLRKFQPIREEALAAAAISPGKLVMFDSAGKFALNTASDINARGAMIAVEDELQGRDINDDYASGAITQAEILQPGDKVQVMLVSGVTAIGIGDRLHPTAAGLVDELANGSFVALEAITGVTATAAQLVEALYVG